mmetsp:Transcript_32389/g.62017  ORF Transcript_32389/g.62017 Transcript_32389/m.62017 type:complete len:1176 (-) Transcript_32389:250-3777(-)
MSASKKSIESIRSYLSQMNSPPASSIGQVGDDGAVAPSTLSSSKSHVSSRSHQFNDERSPTVSFSINKIAESSMKSPSSSSFLSQQNSNLNHSSTRSSHGGQSATSVASSHIDNATSASEATASTSNHRNAMGIMGINTGTGKHSEKSETSESLCNFSKSTPFRVDFEKLHNQSSHHSERTMFSSEDEHGGVIGSPLSAFSAVGGMGDVGSNFRGGRLNMDENGGDNANHRHHGLLDSREKSHGTALMDDTNSASDDIGMGTGMGMAEMRKSRETSLLVSPRLSTTTETTPSTLRRQAASPPDSASHNASPKDKQKSRLHSIRSDLYASADDNSPAVTRTSTASVRGAGITKIQRDPTPYQNRSVHLTSPIGSVSSAASHNNNNASHVMRSGGSSQSDQSSRSGRDPPAKSPFGTIVSSHNRHHFYKAAPNNLLQSHQQYNEENELSMIQEDGSIIDESTMLNQSHASTVTALTVPRTPVTRKMLNNTTNSTSARKNHRETPSATPMSSISTEKLLRRPSQAMRDSFSALASHTAHQLEDVWDLVGVAPEDRAAQLADLVEKIQTLCEEKVDEERGLAEQFRKEIEEARKEWEESCRALQIGEKDPTASLKRDPSAMTLGEDGVSLQTEYEAILGRLESIRAVKAVAVEDIQGSQKRIYEAYAALNGCSLEDAMEASELEQWRDTEIFLTEERRGLFRSKAEEMEESVALRAQAVVSLIRDCQSLIYELKIVPSGYIDADEHDMVSCCDSGNYGPGGDEEVGRSEDDLKIMKSLKVRDSISQEEGQNRRSRGRSISDYTIVSLFESSSCTGISNEALERLTNRLAELNGEKRRRRARLGEMGTAIAALWTMLRVPPEEQRAFTENVRGLGMDTIRLGERELIRLHELKSEMIGKLIREQREQIAVLWEKTNATESEKASFRTYYEVNADEELTDDLLKKHEDYVEALNAKLEKIQPILDLIAKREAIIADRFELENLQKDPDRLKQRGASLTKQLMKEEKMSRRVKKELPKITHVLERTLTAWYEDNRPPDAEESDDPDSGHFMYQNAPYLHTMQMQEEDWRKRKERGEQERQRKRQEERAASSNAAFGSTYSKLPGKKWHPSAAGPPKSMPLGPSGGDLRPRSASNVRGRPLADVSSSRQNVPRPASRPRNEQGKKTVAGTIPSYRAVSAPRMR